MARLRFLDRLFRKEKEEKVKVRTLRLDDIDNILKNKLRIRRERTLNESKGIIENILDSSSIIKSNVKKIEDTDIPNDIHIRLRRILNTSKPLFTKGVMDSISPFINKGVSDFTDVGEFHDDLKKTLDSLARTYKSHGKYLSVAFENEIKTIRRESKNMLENNDRLENIMERSMKENKLLNETITQCERIRKDMEELNSIGISLKKDREMMESLIRRSEKIQREIENLSESEEFQSLSKKKKRLDEIEKKIDEIEGNIFHLLTQMKRPLKKYRKQCDTGIKKIIDNYIENPVEQFFSDNSNSLVFILKEIDKYITEERMKVKDREKRKIHERIKNILDLDLNSMRTEYKKLCEKREDISGSIKESNVIKKRTKLMKDRREIDNNITMLRDEIKNLEDRKNSIIHNIEKLKNKIEENMSRIDKTDKGKIIIDIGIEQNKGSVNISGL